MNPRTHRLASLCLAPALVVCAAFVPTAADQKEPAATKGLGLHYLEIVTPDRDATCELLEAVHGVTFGEPVEALGNARTTELRGGGLLGVRSPMHAAEDPVVRPYLLVDDIEAAAAKATAQQVEFAMPPTKVASGSQFAIYFHGGIQYGLWKD